MAAMLLIKVSVVLAAALGAAWLLRRRPAATRHGVWSVTFAALLALPVLAAVLPALDVPVPRMWRPSAPPAATSAPRTAAVADVAVIRAAPAAPARPATIAREASAEPAASLVARVTPATAVLAIWGAGTLAALAVLALSLLRVRRLARTAVDLTDAGWRDAAAAIAARLGCRGQARLLLSDRVRSPMAGGIACPTIFLPLAATAWTAERRDVVLAHELAHLAVRDPLRHLAARAAVALYWCHPLAWLAAREASAAREQACDEAVLALGTRPSSYAQVLLDFAEAAATPARPVAALPIVEHSLLERRLMAILTVDERVSSRPRSVVPVAAIAILALGVAAARPAALAAPPDLLPLEHATPAAAAPARDVAPPPQRTTTAGTTCWDGDTRSFRGSMSTSGRGPATRADLIAGTRGGDRIVLRSFGDLEVCIVAEDFAGADPALRPSEWPGRARRVVMESARGNVVQRLETTRAGGAQRVVWQVGGSERPFDAAAQAWRERLLAVLDTTWEASRLRGDVSSLRGDISSHLGEESSLRGEMSSLYGHVSSLRGQIATLRGEESSLRGQISSIRGDVSSLRGAISSEEGAISSLQAQRYGADAAARAGIAARIAQHDAAIDKLEKQIRDGNADAKIAAVERQIEALQTEQQVAALERDIRAFDVEGKVAALERRIADLNVTGKTAAIERQIAALDADRRLRQLDERLAGELRQLQDALARVR